MKALIRHKKLVLFLILSAAVAATAYIAIGRTAAQGKDLAAGLQQKTAQIERRTLVESISATGKVVSLEQKNVTADVTGVKVQSVYVKVGDKVSQGDVLCVLDGSDIEKSLEDARATLDVTQKKTQVDVASTQRSLAEAQASRNLSVARADLDVSGAWDAYQQAVADMEQAAADYNEAKAETLEKNAEYEQCKDQVKKAKEALDNTSSGVNNSGQYEKKFSVEIGALNAYINSCGVRTRPGALDYLYITNPELPKYEAEDLVAEWTSAKNTEGAGAPVTGSVGIEEMGGTGTEKTGGAGAPETGGTGTEETGDASTEEKKASPEEIAAEINRYLGKLKELQSAYQQSTASYEGASAYYQDLQTRYQELQQTETEYKSKYETAKQNESSCESAYKQAVSTMESKADAYNQQVRSKEDTVQNHDSTVKSRTDSLKTSNLNASVSGLSDQEQIRKYEKQIEGCTVAAPIGGIVTAVSVEAGGTYGGGTIVTIEDVSAYEITAEIEEYDINAVAVGQKTVIKTNGTGNQEFAGTVAEIAPRATQGASNVTYTVRISPDTFSDKLKMDMTAKLSIIQESRENVLTVPYDFVQEDGEGRSYIEVLDVPAAQPEATDAPATRPDGAPAPFGGMPAGTARKIFVTKGIESDYYVEISGEGIQEGMSVLAPAAQKDDTSAGSILNRRGPMGGF